MLRKPAKVHKRNETDSGAGAAEGAGEGVAGEEGRTTNGRRRRRWSRTTGQKDRRRGGSVKSEWTRAVNGGGAVGGAGEGVEFERKEPELRARAAMNLSFLYFLEGDLPNAEKHAEVAVKTDRYNSRALVNRGNCFFAQGDIESAKNLYMEAIDAEADCIEAIFNLGLAYKKIGNLPEALAAYRKVNTLLPNNTEVIYQRRPLLNFPKMAIAQPIRIEYHQSIPNASKQDDATTTKVSDSNLDQMPVLL
ncbi:hypothetical protein CBR_g44620 [Chara braunii]|uniref:Uncharacterized protein n=1 Tax=Chara braunii TaxID=69332 RepID=A0A388LY53_CHABU|nr:hypothetical protein CBR_g44620 [Chara braunii]|eukprot:GBG87162.1 hypothetical protein CBR_g44620 [Chara braunii]